MEIVDSDNEDNESIGSVNSEPLENTYITQEHNDLLNETIDQTIDNKNEADTIEENDMLGINEMQIKCPECENYFSDRTYFEEHYSNAHDNLFNDLPYLCHNCGERFIIQSDLNIHLSVCTRSNTTLVTSPITTNNTTNACVNFEKIVKSLLKKGERPYAFRRSVKLFNLR